jgi:hypothetical protein
MEKVRNAYGNVIQKIRTEEAAVYTYIYTYAYTYDGIVVLGRVLGRLYTKCADWNELAQHRVLYKYGTFCLPAASP